MEPIKDRGALARLLKPNRVGHSLLDFKHDLQQRMIDSINRLSIDDLMPFADSDLFALASSEKKEACLSAAINSLDPDSLSALGRALEVLTPEQRYRLVGAILSVRVARDDGATGDNETSHANKGDMIGSLGAGLPTITNQHAELVDSVLELSDSGKCWAIYGWGKGLHALDPHLRDRLVRAALHMDKEEFKSEAIGGLAEGMSVLTEQQRNALLGASLQFSDEHEFSNFVMPGLCKGLQALSPEQQYDVAFTVSQMTDEDEFARALCSLGPALKSVTGAHCIDMLRILSDRVSRLHSEQSKASALGHLGAGLHPLDGVDGFNDKQHGQIVSILLSMAMGMTREAYKSRVFAGLAGGIRAFSPVQREMLIDSCLSMENEINRGLAVAGLGASLETLTHDQKDNLLNVSVSLTHERIRSLAIAGLGKALNALTPEQQIRLVDAALGIGIQYKGVAIGGLRDVEDLRQYSRLVDSALGLPSSNSPGLPSPQTQALASLTKRQLFWTSAQGLRV